jgi:hypothetical protein
LIARDKLWFTGDFELTPYSRVLLEKMRVSQGTPRLLRKPKVRYQFQNSPLPDRHSAISIQSALLHFFNIMLSSMPRSLKQ